MWSSHGQRKGRHPSRLTLNVMKPLQFYALGKEMSRPIALALSILDCGMMSAAGERANQPCRLQ
jgi:hypothetical protein